MKSLLAGVLLMTLSTGAFAQERPALGSWYVDVTVADVVTDPANTAGPAGAALPVGATVYKTFRRYGPYATRDVALTAAEEFGAKGLFVPQYNLSSRAPLVSLLTRLHAAWKKAVGPARIQGKGDVCRKD
jgi:hypothetical protein